MATSCATCEHCRTCTKARDEYKYNSSIDTVVPLVKERLAAFPEIDPNDARLIAKLIVDMGKTPYNTSYGRPEPYLKVTWSGVLAAHYGTTVEISQYHEYSYVKVGPKSTL